MFIELRLYLSIANPITRIAWFIMTINGPTVKEKNEWGKSSILEFKCGRCFDSANESPSFKTAWLNDAHLFAVTRRHSVKYCQLIYFAKLTCVCAFSSIPYLQRMDRTDAHLAAILPPGYISILCNVLRHTAIRAYTIFGL